MENNSITNRSVLHSRRADFFADRTPWHRRLWSIGTVLGLREVVEYADACVVGQVANTEGLRFVASSAGREVDRDPGVAHLAVELRGLLDQFDVNAPDKISRSARDELLELSRRADLEYSCQWQSAPEDVPIEFAARAIASHLLDAGFSADHLFRWVRAKESSMGSVRECAEQMATMTNEMSTRDYEVFIPCAAPFAKPSDGSGQVRWLDGRAAAAWLRSQLPTPETRRHSGGFLLTTRGRDPWAAIDTARATIARFDARVKVARPTNDQIKLDGWARIAGSAREFEIHPSPRQVEIGSLYRQEAVYRFDGGLSTEVDDALELASYMESPSLGAAITGSWAAIEGLLIRPDEGRHHLAADRLAALVTCSLPRAELTPLAYEHLTNATDDLAAALQATTTNRDMVRAVEHRLSSGGRLNLSTGSGVAAQDRILAIMADPAVHLSRIRSYVTESLRRLYNQRNTIVHAGSLRSAVLPATVRTSLSLVGAGLDRIVHTLLQTNGELAPLSLVARAETELRLVGQVGGRDLGSLLE